MRTPVLLLSSLLLNALSAQAVSAFGLQIIPRGEQRMNLATGNTDMPQGGTICDSATGLVVQASTISVSGEAVSASGSTLTTRQGGTLRADNVIYTPKQARVTATGNLNYSDSRVQGLSAQTIYVDTRSGAVTAVGNVKTARPQGSAAQLVALPTRQQLLLSGAARLQVGAQHYSADKVLFSLQAGKAVLNPAAADVQPFSPFLK